MTHEKIRCWRGRLRIQEYERGRASCECLAHDFSRAWFAVTGDSYIVHTIPVYGAGGAASYMAKYLAKTFGEEDRFKALGMARRWSSSKGWPGTGRLRLAPSEGEGWKERVFSYGSLQADLVDVGTFDRVGDENTRAYFQKRSVEAQIGDLRRLLHA